jgi:hypothetical protein
MSLTRVYATLNNLIIRKLGDVGGPSSSRVDEELNRIIAWVRSSPRNIHRNFAKVDSVGVGPDVLHTFSLPANSLETNGDYLSVWYAGNFAANDRDKGVQAQFDGQDYAGAGAVDLDIAGGWAFVNRIARIDATHVRISHFYLANIMALDSANAPQSFTEGGIMACRNTNLTVANLASTAITMRVRSVVGVGAAAADVFQNMSIIELTQQ